VYAYGGQTRVSTGNPNFYFYCSVYTSIDCSGSPFATLGSAGGSGSTTWAPMSVPNPTYPPNGILPAGSQSANCRADSNAGGIGGTYHVDNIYFNSQAPTTPIKLQSFDVN